MLIPQFVPSYGMYECHSSSAFGTELGTDAARPVILFCLPAGDQEDIPLRLTRFFFHLPDELFLSSV